MPRRGVVRHLTEIVIVIDVEVLPGADGVLSARGEAAFDAGGDDAGGGGGGTLRRWTGCRGGHPCSRLFDEHEVSLCVLPKDGLAGCGLDAGDVLASEIR